MKLLITNPAGLVVADAEANLDPAADFAHLVATFTAGPGFDQVKKLLDEFERIYATGDLERAAAIHAQVDELGLVASGQDGARYVVFNVYCQKGALQFAVSRAGARSLSGR